MEECVFYKTVLAANARGGIRNNNILESKLVNFSKGRYRMSGLWPGVSKKDGGSSID